MGTESTGTRSTVMAAALRLLREEGPTALRVRRVAHEAGCSTMGVYTHFGGKDGLVEALWLDGFRRFAAALAAVPRRGDPMVRLRRLATTYREWALSKPTHYQLMFARSVPEFEPSAEALTQARGTFVVLVETVAAAQGSGALHPGDPEDVALALWGLVHGLVMIELAGIAPSEGPTDPAALYRSAVEMMLTGLGATAPTGALRASGGPP
ncbi:MAG: TetR/AcrR family transcriptional regulator [Acidimicrobiia bacterium]